MFSCANSFAMLRYLHNDASVQRLSVLPPSPAHSGRGPQAASQTSSPAAFLCRTPSRGTWPCPPANLCIRTCAHDREQVCGGAKTQSEDPVSFLLLLLLLWGSPPPTRRHILFIHTPSNFNHTITYTRTYLAGLGDVFRRLLPRFPLRFRRLLDALVAAHAPHLLGRCA